MFEQAERQFLSAVQKNRVRIELKLELVKHETVAVRLEGESGGMSENEWQPLPDSGKRSKDMARYKTRKKREKNEKCVKGMQHRKVRMALKFER